MTSFAALPSTLSVGDDAARATLADAMAHPSSGLAATIMLDQSLPADEGGKTRLANVIAVLQDRIKALPPNAILGLWTFDGHEGRSEVATGPLADPVNGQPRSAALTAALDKQYSSQRRCGVVHHAAHDLRRHGQPTTVPAKRIRSW